VIDCWGLERAYPVGFIDDSGPLLDYRRNSIDFRLGALGLLDADDQNIACFMSCIGYSFPGDESLRHELPDHRGGAD